MIDGGRNALIIEIQIKVKTMANINVFLYKHRWLPRIGQQGGHFL